MTNPACNRSGGGAHPDLRSPGSGRRVGILCLVLGLLVSAWPAFAAEIVDVRVGKHPEFTRVVFELDRAAGYRIERTDPSKAAQALVVSLEASSSQRSLTAGKSLIEGVDIEPMGSRSVARVRLTKGGLRLKEMILTNPPRIVLDVLNDAPSVASQSTPAKSGKKASTKSTTAAESDTRLLATAEKSSTGAAPTRNQNDALATAQREAREARAAAESKAAAAKARAEAEADALAKSAAAAKDAALAKAAEAEAKARQTAQSAAATASRTAEATADKASDAATAAANALANAGGDAADAVQKLANPEPAPRPIAKAQADRNQAEKAQAKPRPMVAKKTVADDDGGGFMSWALIGVGAIVLLLGGVFLARKRGAGADADEDDSEADSADEAIVSTSEENPFGDLAGGSEEQTVLGAPDDVTVSPMMMDDPDATMVSVPDEEKESESVVFDASQENDMDDMEVISRDQVNESLGGAMPPMSGAIPEEFQQMMAEMSRRMEALESRCDELVDARDRLERQVAAQTEELRVQRAAIARTQRAVRNLGRPEGEEQEATEPALRDPNQPTSD